MKFGDWGSWSGQCGAGEAVCGVATRVEGVQGDGDDTALNDLTLTCCLI